MPSCSIRCLPLTSFQKELWLAHESLPEKHPGIFTGGWFVLHGVPDPALVLQALTKVVEHCPLLGATLRPMEEGMPMLELGVYPDPELRFVDLSGEEDPESAARHFLERFKEEPFEPYGGRLCNFALIRLSEKRSWFLIRPLHLVADGLSIIGHFNLLTEAYESLKGRQCVKFGAACRWEEDIEADQKHLSSSRAENDIRFWEGYLGQLPAERIFPPRHGYPDQIETVGQFDHEFSPKATECLRALASGHGVGLSTIFLALHAIMLSRLYDQKVVSIQQPLSFGERKDSRKIHGSRVSILPLRVELGADDTFSSAVSKVKQQSVALLRRARTPFQLGLRNLEEGRSRVNIWDTHVNYFPAPPDGGSGDFRVHSFAPFNSRYEQMLLGLFIMEGLGGHGLLLSVVHSCNHFSKADVRRYIERLVQLLLEVHENPSVAVSRVSLLLPSEWQSLAVWQRGEGQVFVRGTIPGIFDQRVTISPERTAVQEMNGKRRSYQTVRERSDGIALWLAGRGVTPGEVVAVLARRHPALPETILGIMKAGAVYLPVDPDYPHERIRHMLDDSGTRLILALDRNDMGSSGLGAEVCGIPDSLPSGLPADALQVKPDQDAPAYLIYTSGSTGRPKGVLVSHRGFVNMIQGQIGIFGIGPEDRVLQFASPSFDASLSEIFMALLGGASLYPVSRDLIDTPWDLKNYMVGQRISVLTFPPSYLGLFKREDFPGLRVLITAGEAPVAEDARHYAARLNYFNAYGPTEASVCAAIARVEPDSVTSCIGKPIPNTQAYILDSQGRQVVPGLHGELCLGGEGLALGYLNRPELDGERFISPSFAKGERVYRTGDRAVWTERGEIVLLGRIDEQVKIRGHRVELGEITAAIEEHADVVQAVVLALPGTGGLKEVAAFMVVVDPDAFRIEQLRCWLLARLPEFMIPSKFHILETLPASPTGKVDKQALACLKQSRKQSESVRTEAFAGLFEEEVRTHFEAVLGRTVPEASADFFTIGGDSLKAMDLVRRLSRSFGLSLSVRSFLADATVTAVARTIARNSRDASEETSGLTELPLSQSQFQLWAQECLTGPSPRYNMPLALELEADAGGVERFVAALRKAVERQPLFNCVIADDIDTPHFKPGGSGNFDFERFDLRQTPSPLEAAQRIFDEHIHRPFELTQTPPLRAVLIRLEEHRWHLLLVMHHIVGDAESLGILLRDALRLLRGESCDPLSSSALRRFVEAERVYLNTSEHHADLDFWEKRLSPLPARLELIPNHPRPMVKKGAGDMLRKALSPSVASGLQRLAEQTETTLLGCFLGLLVQFLHERTQRSDIAVAVPVGLRDAPELFDTAGYFVNTVVVRLQEPFSASLPETIHRASRGLREAVAHSRFPFSLLSTTLGEQRDPTRAPLVDLLATHIDQSVLMSGLETVEGLSLRPLDVFLRASKLDFTFILFTRVDNGVELALEYDTGIASTEEAMQLLVDLSDYLERAVKGMGALKASVALARQSPGDSFRHPPTRQANLPAETERAARLPIETGSEPADRFARAWQEVLGGGMPDSRSNFFLCGGDSIKAIQLVGMLRRQGIFGLAPAQFFEFPTFGELQARLESNSPLSTSAESSAYRAPSTDEKIALLPIQRELIRKHPLHWRQFHMALPLRLDSRIDAERLRQALHELPLRHEALRLAFSEDSACLLVHPCAPEWDELSLPASVDSGECFAQASARLFPRLDPAIGRLIGAVLVHRGDERLLLLGGHHLVLDAVSLDILRQELVWYCRHGEWPSRSNGFGLATWAAQLASLPDGYPAQEEIQAWAHICATPTAPLKALNPGVDRASQRKLHGRVVSGFVRTLSNNPLADLLAALSHALHAQGQSEAVFVTLEGHGREAILPGLDISQAVGWFTTTFPLVLHPSASPAGMTGSLQAWFERLSNNGAVYGLAARSRPDSLRYRPQIALNYLGQLIPAEAGKEDGGLEVLAEWTFPGALPGLLHDDFQSDAPLDLIAGFRSPDELCLSAFYSPQCLNADWVEGLLDAWSAALGTLPAAEWEHLAEQSLCSLEEIEAVGLPEPSQEGMLFQHLLDADASSLPLTYTQQINFRLEGDIDETLLLQAWAHVVARHESLRSLFPTSSQGEFRRLVLKKGRVSVDCFDLSDLPPSLQQSRRNALLRAQRQTAFDLAHGPLLQMQFFRFAPGDHEMSWCFHHLLMDGWCMGILLRELFTVYAALRLGQAPDLPPAPPMRRYRYWRQGRDEEAARLYWAGLLKDFFRPTPLARECAQSGSTEPLRELELSLDEAATRGLQDAAARMSATLPNLVQALWGILLGTINGGHHDVVYGLVSSGRPAEVDGIEDMVGLFIQTLPVRVRWRKDEPLSALVAAIGRQAGERAAHEFYPLAEIQRASGLKGALFDHLLVFENYPLDGIQQEGAPRIISVSGFEQQPYALGLSVIPGERLQFRLSYKPSCFAEEQIRRLEASWLTLLKAAINDQLACCEAFELSLSFHEHSAGTRPIRPAPPSPLPESFNRTARAYPRERSVCDIFREIAEANPTGRAFIGPDGTSWTYLELDRVSNAVAAGLGGIEPGAPVAFAMPRGPEAVAVMLGILKAGGCYLPLDEKNPAQRIHNMLRVASCRQLVHWQNGFSRLDVGDVEALTCLDYETLRASSSEEASRHVNAEGGHPAYIMFTSGSTGEPKGVVVPHRAILRLVRNSDFWDIAPEEKVLQAGPLGFDASTLEIWGALLNGGTVCFISDEELLSPKGLRRKILKDRITLMWLTSSLCNLLADDDPGIFAPLRRLYTGGEALNPAHIGRIMAVCPELEIFNGYGPTENTTFTTVHKVTAADLEGPSIPIGKPVANTRVYIVNEQGEPVAIGEWGEICAAGDGLAIGYIGRADLTRRAFIDLPAPTGERVYRTGDLGRWREDGLIEFLGRRDGQVKVRGFRIELSEIETALGKLPGVRQAAVVASGHGEGRFLVAFVRADGQSPAALKAALKTTLPQYMVPDRIEFLDTLPITKNGKLDRAALDQMASGAQKAKAGRAGGQEAGGHHGGDGLEQRIAELFGEVLGFAVESTQADFFDLGGQSLLAMQLLARLNHRLNAGLTMRDVLSHTSVEALARRIRQKGSPDRITDVTIPRLGDQVDYPLSSGQERLWFLQRMSPDSTVYNVPFAARLHGSVDRQALQRALFMLEERHDALRLRMPQGLGQGELRQTIADAGALTIDYRDFAAAPDSARAVAEAMEAELGRPFRFGPDAPLVRAYLFRELADSSVLLLNMHHLVCDGWSSGLLLKDLHVAYRSMLKQEAPGWRSPRLRYVDYAGWQQGYLDSPESEALKARWRSRMMPLPEALNLPADKPRPAVRSFRGDVVRFRLDARQLAGLRSCARDNGVTLFPVLAALVKIFLFRHTGQRDLVAGVPVAGRVSEQTQDLVGFFVNTVPLRDRLQPEAGFRRLVRDMGLSLHDALADQLYPLEALVSSLNVPREGSRNPLFDVLVALEEQSWSDLRADGVLRMSAYPLPHRQSKMDLSFYFREVPEGLCVDIEFNTDLFERATVERMAERFTVLADAALDDPGVPLQTLAIMSAVERNLVLRTFNDTRDEWSLDASIDACFRRQASINPEAVALRAGDGSTLSFGELDRRVAALAGHLQAEGVEQGTYVGVCFERSIELVVAVFAVLRVGAVYVPFVPGLPAARIASMSEDLRNCLVLTRKESAETFRSLGMRVLFPDFSELGAGRHEQAAVPPDAAAYVIFTSGSTGRPKGVVVEHRSALNRIFWMQSRFPLGKDDVILQKTSISFDVSVWELFWWSWTGASLAQLAPGGEKDPAAIVAAVERHGVTVMHFVPSMLRVFIDHLESHPGKVARLRTLRLVFASGEALTSEVVQRFNRLLHAANGTELHNLYGPTEATVDVTWQPCSPTVEGTVVPIGRPISNTRIYILDDTGHPVPIGVAGELFISGIQVARGYVNRPDLTAERFLPDPFSPEGRMYRTGDRARWLPTGAIEYLGRCDDQIKLRGYRIELGEVEAALNRCSGVAQAVVRVGEVGGMPALEAFLLPAAGIGLSLVSIRKELGEFLPDYMCPAVFHRMDSIPLSTSGKADRKALHGERLGLSRRTDDTAVEHSPTQRALLAIWSTVLPDAGQIGIDQNFFEIGGSSLLLVRLHERLEEAWPGCFPLAELFVAVTVRQQAERIDGIATTKSANHSPHQSLRAPAPQDQAVAVIGMALRLGDYEETELFWSDLLAGCDRTVRLGKKRRQELMEMLAAIGMESDVSRFREAAYLDDISAFDCKRFGMAPGDVRLLDPEQRLFLETALRALEDAGYGGRALHDEHVGIFIGASPSQAFKEAVLRSLPEQAEQSFILNVPSSMATRLGYMKNWSGPAALIDTACSSSLKAIRDACQSLSRGECRMALVGGARVLLMPLRADKAFAIETSTGRTRTFDAGADGVGGGEGAVAFLLKPLAQAQADGDAIRAVILGGAVNQDGRSASFAAPSPVAQANVIRAAAADARIELTSIDFFEAHGTATALGDPIEIDGLTRAFATEVEERALIGSVKGNLGHLDAAAGAIGVAKAILSLQHGLVPRQPHFSKPNPRIDFARAPVRVAHENHALSPDRRPWRCGVSAFGLSGINVHLILQQAPGAEYPDDEGSWLCVPLSAGSAQGLRTYVERVMQAVAAHPHWPLHAIAATLTCGREHLGTRLALVARTREEFLERLTAWRLGSSLTGGRKPVSGRDPVPAAGFRDSEQALAAAEAFMNGADPFWPEDRQAYRVHLPAVPLDRIRCWPRFTPLTGQRRRGFLGQAVDGPQGWLFSIPVSDKTFWPVAEHRLGGKPTLVGMAMVALIAEAMERISGQNFLRIEGLTWLRPLSTEQVAADPVLAVSGVEKGFRAVLSARQPDGQWGKFTEARVHRLANAAERMDVESLRQDMSLVRQPGKSRDDSPDMHVVQVGARWDCRRRLWRSPDGSRSLALLVLPDEYHADMRMTAWHPALLDVAASLALDRPGFVPACCREIRLHRPLTPRLYAHVSRRSPALEGGREALHADCVLMDECGEVLAELLGLMFVPLQRPQAQLHRLQWREEPIPAEGSQESAAHWEVLLLGEGALCERLGQALDSLERPYRCEALPADDAGRASLADRIAGGKLLRIIYLIPDVAHCRWELAAQLQALCRRGIRQPLRLLVVGSGALGDVAGSDISPDATLAPGLLLSLSKEEPLLNAGYVEVSGAAAAEAILAELDNPQEVSSPVLITEQGRFVRELSPPLSQAAGPFAEAGNGGCVVFSGGLGAMALTLAEAAVPLLGDSIALLHRGEFPQESEWDRLSRSDDHLAAYRASSLLRLRERGIAFRLYSCDVTHPESLAKTLSRVRGELGAIAGVIHTAGVGGNGFLIHKSREAFEAVLAPKVDAARHLHELTREDRLRFFVLASSRTALTGAPGQTDYSAANAFLDAFAHWRRAQGLPALSIDWNTWERIGMAARWGAVDPSQHNLPPEQAATVLRRALESGATQVVVTMPGESLSPRPATHNPGPLAAFSGGGTDSSLPLDQRVLQIVAQGLGYETPLSPEDDFYALGGDSITGMRIVNRINQELHRSVSLADLFTNSRLGQFIASVVEEGQAEAEGSSTILAAPEQDDYPVSWEQLAILQAEAVARPHTGYNLPQFLQLPENIDRGRLETALNRLVERQEILRTRFRGQELMAPRMQVLPAQAFHLEERFIERLDQDAAQALVRPFKLTQVPLFRAALLRTGNLGAVLFFDIHHAVADARTIDILLGELFALYQGEALGAPGLQQKDAAWHQQQAGAHEEDARRYWLSQFEGTLPKLDLPADHPRPKRHTHRGATAGFEVPSAWLPEIRALAREQATTTYNVMLSLWSLLLGRYAEVDKLVVAVAADGRDREEFSATPGMFVSLLPLHLQVVPAETFSSVLRRNHQLHAEAMRYRSYTLNRLLNELRAPVALDRTLLLEVSFSYMNFESVRQGRDRFKPLHFANPACKGDLSVFASDTGTHLSYALEYYADLFEPARIERMTEHFLDLLRQLLDRGAKAPLSSFKLAGEAASGSLKTLPNSPETARATGKSSAISGGQASDGLKDLALGVFRRFFNCDSIGWNDSFFDLGGHSLLAMQIVNRIAQESGRELTINDLFDHPTPAEMARLLTEKRTSYSRIERGDELPQGRYPLSHAQQRLYVLHHTDGGASAYNMSFIIRVNEPLDVQRLRLAMQRLCERHETLRTALVEEDGHLWQVIQESAEPEFLVHELGEDGLSEARLLFREDAARPFDLRQAPLLRVRICHLADRSSLLSLVMHHIIGDGWSMQIFFGELMAFYAGEESSLPPLEIQYRDYALWQLNKDWHDDAAYWMQALRDAPERISLPGDAAVSAQPLAAGIVKKTLPPALMERVRHEARRRGMSLATFILTLFAALLYRLTRQQDMVIGMGVAGRERAELEGLVGFFVNILPIRIRMDDETELDELLDRVHRASLEALERQDYPFDLLVREVSPERGASREVLINVMFEYQRYSDLGRINRLQALENRLDCTLVDWEELAEAPAQAGPGAKYDLTLFVQDEPGGCRLKAEFDRHVLTEQTVRVWLEYLESFMSNASEPEGR